MAASNYDASLARVLKHEGGYSNHPSDPGGPTNFGITIHDYRRYIKADATAADVRAMRRDDAAKIYRERYWNALRCDELPAGLDYAVFDYGVNSGIGRAAKVMQRLLGTGQGTAMTMTDATIAAARKADAAPLIGRLCDERLAFLKSLRTWPVFGAGWGRRVAEVRRDAIAMAQGAAVAASGSAPANGKANVPVPTKARAATTAGVVVASGGAAQAAAAGGWPWPLIIAIVTGGVLCAIASWAGWSFWHRQTTPALASDARPVARWTAAWLREKLKGWRTLLFGAAVTLASTALDILNALQLVDITPLLPPEHALKIIALIGVVTIALRMITTGRVGHRDC